MIIAIPTNGELINNHFGHCEHFTLIEVDEHKVITGRETLKGSTECGCKSNLAGDLSAKGVNLLLAGGIGQGAINKLKAQNIDVIAGFKGTIDEVLSKWKSNNYEQNLVICTDHHNCSH